MGELLLAGNAAPRVPRCEGGARVWPVGCRQSSLSSVAAVLCGRRVRAHPDMRAQPLPAAACMQSLIRSARNRAVPVHMRHCNPCPRSHMYRSGRRAGALDKPVWHLAMAMKPVQVVVASLCTQASEAVQAMLRCPGIPCPRPCPGMGAAGGSLRESPEAGSAVCQVPCAALASPCWPARRGRTRAGCAWASLRRTSR